MEGIKEEAVFLVYVILSTFLWRMVIKPEGLIERAAWEMGKDKI